VTIESLLGRGRPRGTEDARKVALGAGIGAAIEVYDFIGFGIAAALYLGAAFFPASDPTVATLFAFATLGIGFVARPLGGILAGHLGDRIGRKPVLVASLLVMGICTVLMGFLPTYAQVGALAPVLLITIRVVQGLAFGAEWGGAVLMTYEHAPLNRKGLFTGFMHAGFAAGLLLANVAFLATAGLGNDWSWRIPFLASFALIIVGLLVRSKLGESPAFEDLDHEGHKARSPLREVLSTDWRRVLLGVGIRLAEPAGYAIAVTYMISYLQNGGLAVSSTTLTALCIAALLGIAATPFWGALSDRIGRKPLFIGGALFGAVVAIPLFLMANTGVALLVGVIMICAYTIFQNSLVAAQGTLLPEMFRPEVRFSGASLAYQISAAFAGFTPFVATAMFLWVGWMGPALLLIALCIVSTLCALALPESWSPAHRAAARELIARDVNGGRSAQIFDTAKA
jgi:MFS family permease